MRKDYEKLFSQLCQEDPPGGLLDKVILAIEVEKTKREAKMKVIFIFMLAVSIVMIPFSWLALSRQVANSGIIYYFVAVFSDLGAVTLFWKEFLFAIAEAVPVWGIVMFGGNVVVLGMLWRVLSNGKNSLKLKTN